MQRRRNCAWEPRSRSIRCSAVRYAHIESVAKSRSRPAQNILFFFSLCGTRRALWYTRFRFLMPCNARFALYCSSSTAINCVCSILRAPPKWWCLFRKTCTGYSRHELLKIQNNEPIHSIQSPASGVHRVKTEWALEQVQRSRARRWNISNDDCYYTRHTHMRYIIFSLNGIRFIFVCISVNAFWPAVRCTTAEPPAFFFFISFFFRFSRNSLDCPASEFMIDNDSLWSICGCFWIEFDFHMRPQTPRRAECAERN